MARPRHKAMRAPGRPPQCQRGLLAATWSKQGDMLGHVPGSQGKETHVLIAPSRSMLTACCLQRPARQQLLWNHLRLGQHATAVLPGDSQLGAQRILAVSTRGTRYYWALTPPCYMYVCSAL